MPVDDDVFTSWRSWEGVPSALAAARDGVDALLRDRGLRRTTPALTVESLLRGAQASARLDGSAADLDALRDGTADDLALATARLNGELLSLVPVVRRSPVQAIARMHALAAGGLVAADDVGRPRAEPGVAADLQQLARALAATSGEPAIAVAAIAHAELCRLAPFGSRNEAVGRALERLVLVERGVDPTSMLVIEAGHAVREHEYRRALEGWASGGPAGRREWLLHTARAISSAVEASPLRDDDAS